MVARDQVLIATPWPFEPNWRPLRKICICTLKNDASILENHIKGVIRCVAANVRAPAYVLGG